MSSLMNIIRGPAGDVAWLQGAPVVAYAGIGNPGRVFATIESLGARVVAKETFADHHMFTEREASRLLVLAHETGATLVTTQKDLARLSGLRGKRGELRCASRAVAVRFTFDDRDLGRLHALIDAALKTGREHDAANQR